MSLEHLAFKQLESRWPGLKKNGLKAAIREINPIGFDDIDSYDPGFIPDATLLDFEEQVLIIFEIEDTSKITSKKLSIIQGFGHSVYDNSGWHVELYVTDRWGQAEHNPWGTKDDVAWIHEPTGQWMSDREIEKWERLNLSTICP